MFHQEFAHLPIFQGFNNDQLNLLDSYMQLCSFTTNNIIFEQNANAKFLYIMLQGEVSINYKPYDGPPIIVANILPGSVFGWSAIVGREFYTSGATAVIDSITYRISGQDVKLICKHHPEMGSLFVEKLVSGIAERLNQPNSQVQDLLDHGIKIIDTYIGSKIKNG